MSQSVEAVKIKDGSSFIFCFNAPVGIKELKRVVSEDMTDEDTERAVRTIDEAVASIVPILTQGGVIGRGGNIAMGDSLLLPSGIIRRGVVEIYARRYKHDYLEEGAMEIDHGDWNPRVRPFRGYEAPRLLVAPGLIDKLGWLTGYQLPFAEFEYDTQPHLIIVSKSMDPRFISEHPIVWGLVTPVGRVLRKRTNIGYRQMHVPPGDIIRQTIVDLIKGRQLA